MQEWQSQCLSFDLIGQVQGVGMRPFLYRLAEENSLKGRIFNQNSGASAHLEGSEENLTRFFQQIKTKAQPPIRIDRIQTKSVPPQGYEDLQIVVAHKISIEKSKPKENISDAKLEHWSLSPDFATCQDCWADFHNPKSRFYHYAFVSCAKCGPRWSILRKLPFERSHTSMKDFPLCQSCLVDYSDPRCRRFHAQTISCRYCGPKLETGQQNLVEISSQLAEGALAIVKGLGGFQLVGSALKPESIRRIRQLKSRPEQSLVVMVRDFETFQKIGGNISCWEKLIDATAGIHSFFRMQIPNQDLLAPDLAEVGVMAPATGLHWLLLEHCPLLVVTSANSRGFPIPRRKEEVQLRGDFFIDHNREITQPVDDSVLRGDQVLRAARGLRPRWIPLETLKWEGKLASNAIESATAQASIILALGADLKNAAALFVEGGILELPYSGSLEQLQSKSLIEARLEKTLSLLQVEPQLILQDYAPDSYSSSLLIHRSMPRKAISHHRAHAHAAGQVGDFILAFDGTGFNASVSSIDPEICGGEGYLFRPEGLQQVFQVGAFPFVAGTSMVKSPWKSLVALLTQADFPLEKLKYLLPEVEAEDLQIIAQLARQESALKTSSMGRFFDALSALFEFGAREQSYEAQAPIRLEAMALRESFSTERPMNFCAEDFLVQAEELGSPRLLFAASKLMAYFAKHRNQLSAGLAHELLAQVIAEACFQIKPTRVVGVGGVFQNQVLVKALRECLQQQEIPLYIPEDLPVNDQSIALGQIYSCIRAEPPLNSDLCTN